MKLAIKSSNLESEHLEKLLEVRYINEDIGKCLCIILYGVGMCMVLCIGYRIAYMR